MENLNNLLIDSTKASNNFIINTKIAFIILNIEGNIKNIFLNTIYTKKIYF